MALIKNLAFVDKKKLKNLSSFVESELDFSAFYPFPLDFLHHFLPFKFKFLNESFVAIKDKKIKGLLTVNKTGGKRVKITRLLLDENSAESGKLLVNCVVNLFVSKGAESFYVVVDKTNSRLITMFKDGCGFKIFAKEVICKIENKDTILGNDDVNFEHIRKAENADLKEIKELANGMMCSYQRGAFAKNTFELRRNLFMGVNQYVIFDKTKNKIMGFFIINDINKTDYMLDFVISAGFEGYLTDILKFAKINLSRRKNFKTLYVKLKSYYQNFNELNEILNIEYDNLEENEILIKDFMVTSKQEFAFEQMIFNDPTPAF